MKSKLEELNLINTRHKKVINVCLYSVIFIMKNQTSILGMVGGITLAFAFIIQQSPAFGKVTYSQTSKTSPINKEISLKIRKDMADKLNLNLSNISIIKTQPDVFNNCLNLPTSNEKCDEIARQGWIVTATGGKQRWVYHITKSSDFRINGLKSLPDIAKERVLNNTAFLSNASSYPVGKIQIINAEFKTWKDNCLEIPKQQGCSPQKTNGWLVKATTSEKIKNHPSQWIYHLNLSGEREEFNISASLGQLSKSQIENILTDAARRSLTSRRDWKLTKINPLWRTTCGVDFAQIVPLQGYCSQINVFGWEATVTSKGHKWLYNVSKTGLILNATESLSPSLVDKVIKQAAKQTANSPNTFRLHSAQQVSWKDSCLSINKTKQNCQKGAFPGWQIQLMGNNSMLFTYHTRLNDDIKFVGSSPLLLPPSAPPNAL
jgi:hypothetical protein